MRFKLILVSLLIFYCVNIFSQGESESPVTAPSIKTFSLNPDLLGNLQSSVNLFTGQVNLPINLISMNSASGLGTNVSILYSSANVKKSVNTWNLEAPTSVLGLGWSFSYPQIVRDHKGTATREDDDFYLVENGVSNHLLCINIDNSGSFREYKCKSYRFWKIRWNYTDDTWQIIKEDGVLDCESCLILKETLGSAETESGS